MAITLNNVQALRILNILNKTTEAQEGVMLRMSTGYRVNRGADDPAGLLAITALNSELTAVDAAITSNQRTDAVLGVADGALGEISSLLDDIQRLASESSNDAALSAEELAANQSQIDDALSSIDRIIGNTQFNGTQLLDGSLSVRSTVGNQGAVTDVRVFSRKPGASDTTLTISVATAASQGVLNSVMTTSTAVDTAFSVQGELGTAVIQITADENVSSVVAKVNAAVAQTGVSAVISGAVMNLHSTTTGSDSFVRTSLVSGSGITDGYDAGADASVTINGQVTAVDGDNVLYNGNGISLSLEIGTLGAGSTTTVTVMGQGGATFQLGTNAGTRATLGIEGAYTDQLGTASTGYLASLGSGKANSLLTDPANAATIARNASRQVAQLRGRIGGFQKFQVRTALNSLNDTKEGLEKAKGVIRDVDYATETAELNRQNILLQSAMSLLGMANQQSAQVLSLLR